MGSRRTFLHHIVACGSSGGTQERRRSRAVVVPVQGGRFSGGGKDFRAESRERGGPSGPTESVGADCREKPRGGARGVPVPETDTRGRGEEPQVRE
jgi:hypothetical protein